jgi:predicted AlkP superfamily pyrophosphatase or phosphodiesterase
MVYNNFWYTNFLGDEPGVMEFQFDLVWRPGATGDSETEKLAEALVAEPVVVINPSLPENPAVMKHLYQP